MDMLAAGRTRHEIAAVLGCSYWAVSKVVRRAPVPPPHVPNRGNFPPNAEEIACPLCGLIVPLDSRGRLAGHYPADVSLAWDGRPWSYCRATYEGVAVAPSADPDVPLPGATLAAGCPITCDHGVSLLVPCGWCAA